MNDFPRLYGIVDAACFCDAEAMFAAAEKLVAGGCTLLQYRNKSAASRRMLDEARELKSRLGAGIRLVMNDRADLCLVAGFDGVHVGQDDLSVGAVRSIVGPDRWLGVSTHNPEQVAEANQTSADYIAIGPIFPTGSKLNPDPVVGLAGVRRARELTGKPLVAIGGVTRANARSVLENGADMVAVISDLLPDPFKSAQQFLSILG